MKERLEEANAKTQRRIDKFAAIEQEMGGLVLLSAADQDITVPGTELMCTSAGIDTRYVYGLRDLALRGQPSTPKIWQAYADMCAADEAYGDTIKGKHDLDVRVIEPTQKMKAALCAFTMRKAAFVRIVLECLMEAANKSVEEKDEGHNG